VITVIDTLFMLIVFICGFILMNIVIFFIYGLGLETFRLAAYITLHCRFI